MTQEEQAYHTHASKIPDAEKSQMFGKPCYKIYGKAFCCFFNQDMVFKLEGDMHQEALSYNGTQLFDPSGKGRAMKAWVQVPFHYEHLWEKFALAAADFVGNLKKN